MKKYIHNLILNIALLSFSFFLFVKYSHANDIMETQDAYVSGYLKSIYENNLNVSGDTFKVCNNVVAIDKHKLGVNNPEIILSKTKEALYDIEYVKDVILTDDVTPYVNTCVEEVERKVEPNKKFKYQNLVAPPGLLFEPLMADPAYPRFTLAYQYLIQDKYSRHVFAPNFGASFSLYRINSHDYRSSWEIGVMAGLFGLMDIGRTPTALVNADYYVGMPIIYKSNDFSAFIKPYHLSSHLGDEFMLTKEGKKIKRINLSYEGIDLIASYKLNKFRVYGGGGYIVHKDPSYIKPLKIQIGAEYISDKSYFNSNFRPVTGIDITAKEMANYYPGISVKAGVQLENSIFLDKKIQLVAEYYNGKSIHGQFYNNKMEYIGIALQAFI